MKLLPIKKVLDDSFRIIKTMKTNFCKEIKKSYGFYNTIKSSSDPIFFNKEYATIKIALPRRMGNTTLALKCLNHFKNSIIVAYNKESACRFEDYPNIGSFKNRIYTPKMKSLCGINTDVCVVDCASYLSKKDIDSIYRGVHAGFYVLLG
jgi:hypothetical protein